MQREHFDAVSLELYFRFLAERQSIFVRRLEGQEWPWTTDPILQTEFITNVYRLQDPGTMYLVNNILSAPEASDEDIVFNIMLYRLMGSVPSTHEHLRFQKVSEFDPAGFRERLEELPDDHRIFGDAYRVASYHHEGSASKVDNVAATFQYLVGGMEETMRRINAARSVVEVYKVFEGMKGFGEFLSHQIVVDLLYQNSEGQTIVPFGENEFAKAGPGARKGIWDLIAEGYRPNNMLIVMQWLWENQEAELDRLGILFPWPIDGMGDRVLMSLCDIQASLCEFHKYYRLWNGDRKAQVRKYDRETTRSPVVAPWAGIDDAGAAACLMREEPWTYAKTVETPEEAAEGIEEPSGTTSEILEGVDRPLPDEETPSRSYAERADWPVQDVTDYEPQTLSIEPHPGVTLNITINVYPPK